ncbi:MAG: Rrf2 family transcriptional regulator [Xanthomonadales bacterium]|nr:Rrf2 family transcriptional regulator [Xanthomonadales bacterium]NIX11834.1 Rrf2 family transcriptional regulator [Xanthomonadales bacterium]
MRLTRFTDYSLRVLIYLGLQKDQLVTIRRISDAYGISRNHLMKVVSLLTRMGYLKAQRGPGGGIRLARPPEQINLADVIKDTEEDLVMVECFDEEGNCIITPVCKLQHIIGEALGAYIRTMRAYTLDDLLDPQKSLTELLEIPEKVA